MIKPIRSCFCSHKKKEMIRHSSKDLKIRTGSNLEILLNLSPFGSRNIFVLHNSIMIMHGLCRGVQEQFQKIQAVIFSQSSKCWFKKQKHHPTKNVDCFTLLAIVSLFSPVQPPPSSVNTFSRVVTPDGGTKCGLIHRALQTRT